MKTEQISKADQHPTQPLADRGKHSGNGTGRENCRSCNDEEKKWLAMKVGETKGAGTQGNEGREKIALGRFLSYPVEKRNRYSLLILLMLIIEFIQEVF